MQFSASANSWLLAVAVVMGANTLVAQVERPRFVLNTSGPVDAVQSVAFSPDSRRLYAGGFDKVVYAWDLIQQKRRTTANLAQTLRWQISRGQRGVIYTIATSPIDRTLAIGGVSARNANGDIVLYDTAQEQVIAALQGKVPIENIDGHSQVITAIAWSPDGKTLATTSIDAELRVWSVANGQGRLLRQGTIVPGSIPPFKQDSVWPVVFLTDTVLAAASPIAVGNADGQIQLFDLTQPNPTPQSLNTIHAGGVVAIAKDRNSDQWASAARAGGVYLWQGVPQGEPRQLPVPHPAGALAFAGPTLFVAGIADARGMLLEQWHLATGTMLDSTSTTRIKENAGCLAVSPDERWLATCGGDDGPLVVFPLKNVDDVVLDKPLSGQRPPIKLRGRGRDVGIVAFADDRTPRLAFGPVKDATHFNRYGELQRAFDFHEGALTSEDVPTTNWRTPDQNAAGWSLEADTKNPYTLYLMFGGKAQSRIQLNADRQGELSSYCWLGNPPLQPWGIAIGTTHQNGVYVYKTVLNADCPLMRHYRDHTDRVMSITASGDRKYLASGSLDQTIKIWSLDGIDVVDAAFPRAAAWGASFQQVGARLIVRSVVKDGIAARRGMQEGDQLVSLLHAGPPGQGDIVLHDANAIRRALLERDMWENYTFKVQRQGQLIQLPTIVPGWEPLMTLFVDANGEWALSTPQGPYNASVGGGNLFGWLINQGVDKTPKFFPAEDFREEFERPEVLQKLFTVGRSETPASFLEDQLNAAIRLALTSPLDAQFFKAGEKVPVVARLSRAIDQVFPETFMVRAYLNGRFQKEIAVKVQPGSTEVRFDVAPIENVNSLSVQVAPANGRSSNAGAQRLFSTGGPDQSLGSLHIVAMAAGQYAVPNERLSFPVADAEALIERLNAGAAGFYKKGEVIQLYEDQPSSQAWLAELARLNGKVQPDDLVVFYIGGHGEVVDSELYFVPALPDLKLSDRAAIKQKGVSWEIIQQVNRLSCSKFVLLDTCNSGNSFPADMAKRAVRGFSQMLVLTASSENQKAIAFPADGHSAFTKALLDGWNGEADRLRDGEVDVPETIRFVRTIVPSRTSQNPMAFPEELIDRFGLQLIKLQAAPLAAGN